MKKITSFFNTDSLEIIFKKIKKAKKLTLSGMSNASAKSYLLSYFGEKLTKNNFFLVVNSNDEGLEIGKDLKLFYGKKVFYIDGAASDDYKINIISKINNEKGNFFIFTQKVLKDYFASFEEISKNTYFAKKGDKIDVFNFFDTISSNKYEVSADAFLEKGQYRKIGGVIDIFCPNEEYIYKIEVGEDKISNIYLYNQVSKKVIEELKEVSILPFILPKQQNKFIENISKDEFIIFDELDFESPSEIANVAILKQNTFIDFNLFPDDDDYNNLRFLSVLKFYNTLDLITDLNTKIEQEWKIIICTKRETEIVNILKENRIKSSIGISKFTGGVNILKLEEEDFLPHSFQNPDDKILFLSEKEIFTIQKAKRNQSVKKMSLDFITSLKAGDFIVHFDYGIGYFEGIVKREFDGLSREYLKVSYAGDDKVFVPIDQVDKMSKYLNSEIEEPQLSKIGSLTWKNIQRKVKEESRKMGKELLDLYAKRVKAKRIGFGEDTKNQEEFEKDFPYDPTPGQIKAINDIKEDMSKDFPMDRLVVGDVGFGKTEVAMRAAFKAIENGKQVAVIVPVTILAVQHFEGFRKRMEKFGKKIASLTRFQTGAEQKEVLKNLEKGKIDVLIGTHRILSNDIKFFNLGLVVIDEEQKFGVNQKEKLKKFKINVDVLTMTATPIPRTLSMGLNKLRDITTITTPPQGRLPIISELRKYSDAIVRDAILKEIKRKGQVYFLHNRVETIDGITDKLQRLIPEASFITAHGKLSPHDLENRILSFKQGKADVLVSSTIIENGIDFKNANTIIINAAEKFGLSQLYQLRGRIGRGTRQAFAYFLYQSRGISVDAKKRLKAIVEASELGAGFQIAMKDLEIRGAGDILGGKQSGSAGAIGASHFLRVLEKTVEELKSGGNLIDLGEEEFEKTTIDLPIDAFIPDDFIPDVNEKMSVYQKLSAVNNEKVLDEVIEDLIEEYGKMPYQIENLKKLIKLKISATNAKIKKIFTRNVKGGKELVFTLSDKCDPKDIFNILGINENWQIRGDSVGIFMDKLGKLWIKEVQKTVESMIPKRVKKKK